MSPEWVIGADSDSGFSIVRSGYATAGEAAAARRELEAKMADDDTTNFLLLTRATAEMMLRADPAPVAPEEDK